MKTLLWLDDYRNPFENGWLIFSPIDEPFRTIWVKDYDEFCDSVIVFGLPDGICFDYDLGGDMVNNGTMSKRGLKRFRKTDVYKNGHDCAKFVLNYCDKNKLPLPKWNCHSANPEGKACINNLLLNYLFNRSV